MVDTNKTLIAVVLDRSGSMESIKHDMEGGYARFIDEQRKLPGECRVSLYQFDGEYQVCYEDRPIANVPRLELVPRGSTALLDALGNSIVRVGQSLAQKPEHERPAAVIIVVITDGQENASREYDAERVRQMVGVQEQKYNWRFMYLGSAASTWQDAGSIGIASAGHYSKDNARGMYAAASSSVGNYREMVQRGNLDAKLDIDQEIEGNKGKN